MGYFYYKILIFFLISCIFYPLSFIAVFAATNINSVNYYAWNDNIGWIDFFSSNTVQVYYNRLEGYANSSVDYIALNCNSTPVGDICSGPAGNWRVSNDGNGNLTGWAWNDGIGWISFDSVSAGSAFPYQVFINSTTGEFSGWAWNDNIGWISFNCNNSGIGDTCGISNYKTQTSWNSSPLEGYLYSSIFDTQVTGGASINSIIWKGAQPSGTAVRFQIASSDNSGGPWNYNGPDGSSSSYYIGGPDTVIPVNLAYNNNKRYMRYKVILNSDNSQTQTPAVYDIIINWGP